MGCDGERKMGINLNMKAKLTYIQHKTFCRRYAYDAKDIAIK